MVISIVGLALDGPQSLGPSLRHRQHHLSHTALGYFVPHNRSNFISIGLRSPCAAGGGKGTWNGRLRRVTKIGGVKIIETRCWRSYRPHHREISYANREPGSPIRAFNSLKRTAQELDCLDANAAIMLDVNDFITERGGNPERIRESQRKRYANVEIVDEVIADWDDHRRSESGPRPCWIWSGSRANVLSVSPLRCNTAQRTDQRNPEADRSQEEGAPSCS